MLGSGKVSLLIFPSGKLSAKDLSLAFFLGPATRLHTLEVIQCLVDFVKLAFGQIDDPVISVLYFLSFPYQQGGKLLWKTTGKCCWKLLSLLTVLRANLVPVKVWVVRNVWLSQDLCGCHCGVLRRVGYWL